MPAEGTPLAAIADELAARARAGDNAAAMRLAFDLQRCHRRGYAEVTLDHVPVDMIERPTDESVSNFEVWREVARAAAEFCAGMTSERIDARGEWVFLAAARGDTQAMVCYAAHPNDLGPAFLSDAWFDWSQRWSEHAPRLVDEAYARGQLDVLTLLAESYSGNMFESVPLGMAPLQGLVTPDHARAAAYAEIAHRAGLVNKVYADIMRAQLDGAGRQRAEAIVDRDAQRFATQKHALRSRLPCPRLWKSR